MIARAIINKSEIVEFARDASVDITSLANLRRDALHLQIQTDNFIRDPASGLGGLETERALLYNDLRAQADRTIENPAVQAKIKEIQSGLDHHDQLLRQFEGAKLEEFRTIISEARETMADANSKIEGLYEGAEDGLFIAASDSLRTQRSSQIMLMTVGGLVMLVGGVLVLSLHRSFRSHSNELAARTIAQEAERQRKEELETLFDIAGILAQPGSFQIRCENVLENLADVVDADVALLMTLDEESQVLRLVTQAGTAPWGRLEEVPLESVAGTALRNGAPFAVNNYRTDQYLHLDDNIDGIGSAAAIPIKVGVQNTSAVLSVVSREPGHFTPERMRLLAAVGDGLGVLLDQNQLSRDLAANLEEMAGIDEVARIITSTLDIEQMYGTFTAEMKKLVPFDQAYLNLLDHETGEYTVKPLHGADGSDSEVSFIRSNIDTNNSAELHNGEHSNGGSSPSGPVGAGKPRFLDLGLGNSIAVPMKAKGRVVGSLELLTRSTGAYGPRERVILERLARHIAPAMENARL